MHNFIFRNPVELIFGKGQISKLSEKIAPGTKVMMTFGGGSIFKNGIYDQVKAALKGVEVIAFFPSLYDTVPDICGTDPQGVRFPGGVDVRQDYPVRQAEGRGKIVQKSFGAAVGMGLEHAPEGFVGIIAGRF